MVVHIHDVHRLIKERFIEMQDFYHKLTQFDLNKLGDTRPNQPYEHLLGDDESRRVRLMKLLAFRELVKRKDNINLSERDLLQLKDIRRNK